jgi:hypothetical protein
MSRLLRTLRNAGAILTLLTCGVASVQAQRRHAADIDRGGVPEWKEDLEVPLDVFRFVRVQYTGNRYRRWGGEGDFWETDSPDADYNLAFRLHEMTSMRVFDRMTTIRLDDPRLIDYPFIYAVEPGYMTINDEEAQALRKYLLGGGFFMLDDFWGVREGENAADQIKKAFPDRDFEELPLDHPVFHCVFDMKQKPQVPGIGVWHRWGVTYERPDARDVDYRAMYDDKGRMMVIYCHNTDNGDGWEREGEDAEYFARFSEKQAYPLMINILFYTMTH